MVKKVNTAGPLSLSSETCPRFATIVYRDKNETSAYVLDVVLF